MICPLRSRKGDGVKGSLLIDAKCPKEKCAWFDNEYKQCVMLGIKIELVKLNEKEERYDSTIREK